MEVTRKSIVSGKIRTLNLPITNEQYNAWMKGFPIQKVMPHLSADDCEFLKTGITKEEWDTLFTHSDEA